MKRIKANIIISFIASILLLTYVLCQASDTVKDSSNSKEQAGILLDELPSKGGDITKEPSYMVLIYKSDSEVVAKGLKGDVIAIGTAGSDDAEVIKSAIDSITEGEILCIGAFSITSTINNLKSGIHLRGIHDKTVFNCSKMSQDIFSVGDKGYASSVTLLEEDVNAGSNIIEVEDASGYKEGGYVKIVDDDGILGFKKGEILRIFKIKGNEITFMSNLKDSYSSEKGANIRRLALCYDLTIEGIRFLGPGMDTDLNLLSGYLLKDFEFTNNEVKSFGKAAIHLTDSRDCTLSGNTIEDVFMNGLGYSIAIYNACYNIDIIDNQFKHKGRHYSP